MEGEEEAKEEENIEQPEEREKDIEKEIQNEIAVTQGTTSTDFTKMNRNKFLQTITSNFSGQSNNTIKDKILSRNRNSLMQGNKIEKNKNKVFSPLKTVSNYNSKTLKKTRDMIMPLTIEKAQKKLNKNRKQNLIQNLILPRNINSYTHLIRGKGEGNYAEINWVLRLRDYDDKNGEEKEIEYKDYYYRKKQNEVINPIKDKEKEKIKLTENFNPPYFYDEDLKKYKNKIKKQEKSNIIKLNPNFFKIKHLIYRNKGDFSNESQFHFATTLRNIKPLKENNKKFEILPVVDKNNKINKYFISKFLAPCTKNGIQNLKKIEKYLSKKYEYNYKPEWVGSEKIFKKILSVDNKYSLSGIGETLGDVKYDNIFREKNYFRMKQILKTEANPMSKFELNLRTYGNDEDLKNKTHRTFKPKKKKIKI